MACQTIEGDLLTLCSESRKKFPHLKERSERALLHIQVYREKADASLRALTERALSTTDRSRAEEVQVAESAYAVLQSFPVKEMLLVASHAVKVQNLKISFLALSLLQRLLTSLQKQLLLLPPHPDENLLLPLPSPTATTTRPPYSSSLPQSSSLSKTTPVSSPLLSDRVPSIQGSQGPRTEEFLHSQGEDRRGLVSRPKETDGDSDGDTGGEERQFYEHPEHVSTAVNASPLSVQDRQENESQGEGDEGRDEGCAVLSPYEVVESSNMWLGRREDVELAIANVVLLLDVLADLLTRHSTAQLGGGGGSGGGGGGGGGDSQLNLVHLKILQTALLLLAPDSAIVADEEVTYKLLSIFFTLYQLNSHPAPSGCGTSSSSSSSSTGAAGVTGGVSGSVPSSASSLAGASACTPQNNAIFHTACAAMMQLLSCLADAASREANWVQNQRERREKKRLLLRSSHTTSSRTMPPSPSSSGETPEASTTRRDTDEDDDHGEAFFQLDPVALHASDVLLTTDWTLPLRDLLSIPSALRGRGGGREEVNRSGTRSASENLPSLTSRSEKDGEKERASGKKGGEHAGKETASSSSSSPSPHSSETRAESDSAGSVANGVASAWDSGHVTERRLDRVSDGGESTREGDSQQSGDANAAKDKKKKEETRESTKEASKHSSCQSRRRERGNRDALPHQVNTVEGAVHTLENFLTALCRHCCPSSELLLSCKSMSARRKEAVRGDRGEEHSEEKANARQASSSSCTPQTSSSSRQTEILSPHPAGQGEGEGRGEEKKNGDEEEEKEEEEDDSDSRSQAGSRRQQEVERKTRADTSSPTAASSSSSTRPSSSPWSISLPRTSFFFSSSSSSSRVVSRGEGGGEGEKKKDASTGQAVVEGGVSSSLSPSAGGRQRKEVDWSGLPRMPVGVAMHLLESCVERGRDLFVKSEDLLRIVKQDVCCVLYHLLSNHAFDFSIVIRSLRLFLLLLRLFSPFLLDEIHALLPLILRRNEADASLWQRTAVLETLYVICSRPALVLLLLLYPPSPPPSLSNPPRNFASSASGQSSTKSAEPEGEGSTRRGGEGEGQADPTHSASSRGLDDAEAPRCAGSEREDGGGERREKRGCADGLSRSSPSRRATPASTSSTTTTTAPPPLRQHQHGSSWFCAFSDDGRGRGPG